VRWLREKWARARGSEDFAWACLFTNVVGVPGLGTLMAQRWEGVPQLILAVIGGVLLTWWLIAFMIAELRTMELPPPGGPALGLVLWGLAFFTAGWLWALASSVAVFRATRRGGPPSRRGNS
jgi:fluoride ion exporter CrcB/FEX